jgi:hypothetical protein
MFRTRLAGRVLFVLMCALLLASSAWAQSASSIGGVVKDTSGSVLPGVTVEAASPALIEKVKTAVTDGEGRYSVVDLRPGVYSVTFTLPGFSTFRREGVELTSGFTATINADMQVGALEETITVSGESPLVDVARVTQQKVLAADMLNDLPATDRIAALTILIPGLSGGTSDVGGLGAVQGAAGLGASFHGKGGGKWNYDGMGLMNMQGSGNASYVLNRQMVEETVLDTGGAGADSGMSGVSINGIPKSGGNLFSTDIRGNFGNGGMQSNNLDDKLRARGLTTVNELLFTYDFGAAVGGPIKRDRLWFYSGVRFVDIHTTVANIFNNLTQHTPFYTPGDIQAERWESYQSYATRLTWQASPKNKISGYVDPQPRCDCRRPGVAAPEAQTVYDFWPQGLYQASWSAPLTSRLLVEAGFSMMQSHYSNPPPAPGAGQDSAVLPTDISIQEQSRSNLLYNASTTLRSYTDSHRWTQRFATSYVTGTHSFKTGFEIQEGVQTSEPYINQNVSYRFNNQIPNRVVLYANPFTTRLFMNADLGIYAQDQWTVGNRLTLSYGLRFDYLNAVVRPQDVPATRFIPARSYDAVENVPNWKDISPRLGAAYDLFGNGRTAVKFTVGKYMGRTGVDIANDNNPILTSINSVNRSWSDTTFPVGDPRRGNFVPDCILENFTRNGECGPIDNDNFGKTNPLASRYDPAVLNGFGARDYLWEVSTEIQQEVMQGLSVNGGYYHNWQGNFRATDNTLVSPSDYTPYCIKAPVHPELPDGGGYQVCGLADISEAQFGKSATLVTSASNFGEHKNVNDFFSLGFNARFPGGARLGGGLDTGRSVLDTCYVIDSPQALLNCRNVAGFGANLQIKLNGSYTFPGEFVGSLVFQNISGVPITAAYSATTQEIAPSLGRPLAGSTTTVTVPLIAPNTVFEPRRNQFDLRVGKRFSLGPRMKLQANVDLYNAFNSNSVTSRNNNYGNTWGVANSVLDGRMAQISGNLTF